ncbi:MAG: Crossover junction endodeoxyribonuclease RuvC [Parcubacteria group bacterium GW2011_GWA2_52_8]|nr:MAG: Crossover junction endodeoxyribonuclease RuvC [Parcubacteria group bacterium GW2011_GWA2_52_8]
MFFYNNVKTAIAVAQARGVVLLCAEQHKLTLREFTPLQIKNSLTGYGKAEKKQVQYMVMKLLGLKSIPKPDDAADALAVAICASSFR